MKVGLRLFLFLVRNNAVAGIRRYGQSYARISGFTFLICFLLFTILFSDYLFTDNLSIFSYRHFLRQICVN
jgi:hypothetical protein